MLKAARRTHGIARETFFANALSGGAEDQRKIVETAMIPLAIVNGSDDAFINGAYFATLHYANLWDGEVHVLKGVGHAPFWEAPDAFNPLLGASPSRRRARVDAETHRQQTNSLHRLRERAVLAEIDFPRSARDYQNILAAVGDVYRLAAGRDERATARLLRDHRSAGGRVRDNADQVRRRRIGLRARHHREKRHDETESGNAIHLISLLSAQQHRK